MNVEWNSCSRCHTRIHDLKYVTSDLLKLVRRAERGANVAAQIKVKQERANDLRAELKLHKEAGIDSPHPERIAS